MVLPNLIHPVPVQLQQLVRSQTFVDTDFEEPVENVARATIVTLPGQVKWGADERKGMTASGAEANSDGYVLLRHVDMRAVGVTSIRQGDKFLQLGGSPNAVLANVFVVRVQALGHYQDQNGPSMMKAYFRDRSPAQAPGAGLQ